MDRVQCQETVSLSIFDKNSSKILSLDCSNLVSGKTTFKGQIHVSFSTSKGLLQDDKGELSGRVESSRVESQKEDGIKDCKEDEECFIDAVLNCQKAKMKELLSNDSLLLKEVTDIQGNNCNILYAIKVGPYLSSWLSEKINQISNSEFQELNEDIEDEFGFKVYKNQIIDALTRELNVKITKGYFLGEYYDEEVYYQGKNEDLAILNYFIQIIPFDRYGVSCILGPGISCSSSKVTPNGIILLLGNENYKYNETGITVDIAGCGTTKTPSTIEVGREGRYNLSCTLTGSKFITPLFVNHTISQIYKSISEFGLINTEIEDK